CAVEAELVLRYRVYAFDLSVRAAFLDAERGFFNGTGVCLRVEGREAEAHRLALAGLAPGWQVATTLAPHAGGAAHEFVAADYDELVDHPVALGARSRGARGARRRVSPPPTTTIWSITRSSPAASGAAVSPPQAWRTSSPSPAPFPLFTARPCYATRSAS